MFTYDKYYKEFVNRTIHDYLQPQMMIGSEVFYPKDSMIFWYKSSDDIEYISKDLPYFFNMHKPVVLSVMEYTKLAQQGKFKKISYSESKFISKLKRFESKMKFIKSNVKKLSISSNQEFIYNLASLNHFYKYNTDSNNGLYKWFNSFLTTTVLMKNENSGNQRHKFLIIDLPSTLLPHSDVHKYMEIITSSMLSELADSNMLTLIDIYRLMHSKYREKSLLAQIPYSEYENITLLFHFNGNVSLFNLKDLFSLNSKYNISSKLPNYGDETVSKILTIMFNKMLVTPGRLASDMFTESSYTENSNDMNKEVTPDKLEDLVESLQDEKQVKDNITKERVKTSKIDDMFEEIEVNEELENEEEEIVEKDLKELQNKIDDEVDMLKKEIDLLKDKKLITKKEYENVKTILEKQGKQKSPYPEVGNTIQEARKYDVEKFRITEEDKKITDNKVVIDKSMNESSAKVLNTKYIKEVYKKDILNAVYGIQKAGVIIQEHKVEVKESIMGKQEYHTLVVKQINGSKTTLRFVMPVIDEDGVFKMSGNPYNMRKQKADLPIRKFNSTTVGLNSYYGKLDITKATYIKDDPSFYISKILTSRFKEGVVKNLVALPVANIDVELPKKYQMISRTVKAFKYKTIEFYLEYKTRNTLCNKDNKLLEKIENKKYFLIGKTSKDYVVIDNKNILYYYDIGKYKEISDILTYLEIPLDKMPIEFVNVKLFKVNVPLGIMLAYYLGFNNLLKLTKVKYKTLKPKERYTLTDNEYFITFQDVKYVITKDDGVNDLLFGGFHSLIKILKTYTKNVFNNKDQMVAIFNKLGLSVLHVNEISLLRKMYVDDITASLLKELKYPTTFIGLLIKATEMLADYNYKHPNDISNMVFKGYERIPGFLYKELVNAIRTANNKSYFSKSKIEMNPYVVMRKITEDSNVMLQEDLNPIASIKQVNDTSYTGHGGRSEETMTLLNREMHQSELGIVSENSKDSGSVGVSGSTLSANPNIKSVRGTVEVKDMKDITPTNLLSVSALMAPFSTKDDIKRLNFISIMNGHVVPMKEMKVPYVRTGFEAVIPLHSNSKFIISAEEEGIVDKVTKDNITVKYKSGKTKKYKLKEWNTKEESGATYTHKLITSLKPKDKFSKDDTIAYDKFFYEPDVFNKKRVIMKIGSMVNVAMKDIPQTFEDSAMMSSKLDKRMGLELTKVKSFIIDKTTNIIDIVNVGDKVTANSPLFSMMDGELTNDKTLDKRTLEILQSLKMATPKAKVDGKIVNIKVFYNFDKEEASKSIKKIINDSDTRLIEREGFPGRVDSSYSTNGKKLLEDTMELKIYINVKEGMGIGDKAVIGNQLKFTMGEIYDYDIKTDTGKDVELIFSYLSVAARIVNSPELIGTTSNLLEEVKNQAVDMYFN